MRIRDPVHGDILLPDFARDLLDTEAMQRLRGIRQLGFAHLVYPGCVHTRFDHSLGTAHTALALFRAASGYGEGNEVEALVCAALLHDIGHIPFGHTLEDEFHLFARHDSRERLWQALQQHDIKAVLVREGLFRLVSDILLHDLPANQAYLGEMISSTIDADVLDYLRRDAYFAGLVHNYDDRVLANFTIDQGQLVYRLMSKGLMRQDARSELLHLLRLRYYLTERVCFHHTKIGAGAMLAKLVGRLGLALSEMQEMGDDLLLHSLVARAAKVNDEHSLRLALALRSRRLYKRSYVSSAHDHHAGFWANRVETERSLARLAGVHETEVCVFLGPLGSFKEADIAVSTVSGITPFRQLPELELSALFAEYQRLCRFYVFAPQEHCEKVKTAAEELFACTSEFSRR
jgi:HD superfamily phosphohydrolase